MKNRLSRRRLLRSLFLSSLGLATAACTKIEKTETIKKASEIVGIETEPPEEISNQVNTNQDTQPDLEETKTSVPTQSVSGQAYLAVARGEDTAEITRVALKALGGIERFVKNGFDVIIKPNICTDYYSFEYGATTNPVVVATLVSLTLGAGAKRVRVMDFPFGGTAASAYSRSGIEDAVIAAGGEMELMNPNKFSKTIIPDGIAIQEWPIYQDVLKCDLLINVPIAKHHNLARLTLAGKNLLGVIQNRSSMHQSMGQRVADLVSIIRPGLTVIDAVRMLMNHGPTGGNLDDVRLANTVIASHDLVAADTYAASLFDLTADDISYIAKSAEMGLGTSDLTSVQVEEVVVN